MSFASLNLNKTPGVVESTPTLVGDRQVDFSKMMDGIAIETLNEINSCVYSNGGINEDRAECVLHSIKGRMMSIRQMVASLK